MDAIAFCKPLFSGRSNSLEMEPVQTMLLPGGESSSVRQHNRQYDPKSKSMFSSIIGAMYCAYSICAFTFVFAPDVLDAPSNRSSGSTSNSGKFNALFSLIAFRSSFFDISFSFKRSPAKELKSKACADLATNVLCDGHREQRVASVHVDIRSRVFVSHFGIVI